jgi:hypothetical protein
MTTERIRLVQGDTGPQIRVLLTDETSGDPIDLTGATVTMHFRATDTTTVLFSRQAYLPNPGAGEAVFQFQTGDLDQPEGSYEAEVEVHNTSTGFRQTVYDLLKFKLRADFA